MTVVDLVIQNAKIVTSSFIVEAGIAIDQEKIVSIAKDAHLPSAGTTIEAKGNFVLPGLIDVHGHLHDPEVSKTDFISGTKAAAAGGWTTILEMPVTLPGVWNPDIFKTRAKIAERKCFIDIGLFGSGGWQNTNQIANLAAVGAVGYKTYMNEPSETRLEEFFGMWAANSGQQYQAMREIAKTGLINTIHAEDADLIAILSNELKEIGRMDPMAYRESRPNATEALAISKVRLLAKETGCRAHIAHMHSREGVEIVSDAKAKGEYLTAETAVHYLVLTDKEMKRYGGPYGTYAKCAPPLGTEEDQESLWKGLNNGTINCIMSDHSPYPREQKDTNIWDAQAGIPASQSTLPLMLTYGVHKEKITLNQLAKVTSENPAKLFGLYPKKGGIHVGADGDLVIINLKQESMIKEENLYTRGAYAIPYLNWEVKGMPTHTIVRGKIVMENGDIVGKQGHCVLLRPKKFKKDDNF